jgi:hypothetical protein
MAVSEPTIGIRPAGNNVRHGIGDRLLGDANLSKELELQLDHDRILL